MRAVVKDTSAAANSSTAGQQVFLDSDSHVSDNVLPAVTTNTLSDGRWHMVTVTTHADMTKGFKLYLDGAEVGDMMQGSYPSGWQHAPTTLFAACGNSY